MPGNVTRTIIVRQLTLQTTRQGDHLRVALDTAPPLLRKADLTPLEEVVLQLAALYQRVVVDIAATGALMGLVNHPDITRTWAALRPALEARYGAQDELMTFLLASVDVQVNDPVQFLASLRHDYLYALLLTSWGGHEAPGRAVEFPSFIAELPLWFTAGGPVARGAGPDGARRQITGQLAESRTDRGALARALAPAAALDPAALDFAYRAAYELDPATGWPGRLEATVTCASPAGYAKEYDLTLQQL